MGKYSRVQAAPPQRRYDVHPIWRGIGCLFVLIGPALAFAIAHVFVEQNSTLRWIRIPREVMSRYTIPYINYTVPHFYATLILGGILMVLGVGVIMVVYAIMYRILGPSRYSPLDSPPVRSTKGKRRK